MQRWTFARLATVSFYEVMTMITEQQIDMLVDMYELEWGDYIEYLENEGEENDEI